MAQPVCGPFPAVEGPALGRVVEWIVQFLGYASVAGSAVKWAVSSGTVLAGGLEGFLGWLASFAGGSVAGAAVPFAGAVAGAAIAIAIVAGKVNDRLSGKPGQVRCYAGVVNGIARAFSSGADYLVPYNAQHDRVDVVVKQAYWDLINATPARFAFCATDRRTSALIRSYFFSQKVKNAAIGSAVGVGVGAAAGIVAGVLAGMATGAALGGAACSLSAWFYLLCLAIVVLVAAVVALVIALVSASAGGVIGANTSFPASGPSASGGMAILLGAYITLNANLAIGGEDNDAWIGWWVDETTSPPALHGLSTAGEGTGGGAPFNFPDADSGFTDACPVP